MYRYRVDFYVNGKVVGYCYVNAWSRREAWVDSRESEEYDRADAIAIRDDTSLMWDATRISNANDI